MKPRIYGLPAIIAFYLFTLLPQFTLAQSLNESPFYYLSPLPGAKMIRPENGIILKTHAEILPEKINSGISIKGSTSGQIDFELKILRDENAILIRPLRHFKYNEAITVSVGNAIFKSSLIKKPIEYVFYTMKHPVDVKYNPEELRIENAPTNTDHNISDSLIAAYDLPADFPEYEITQKTNPSSGYFFFAPLKWEGNAHYILIMDNEGFPVFYRKNPGACYDFKAQNNLELSYYLATEQKFVRLDHRFDQIGFWEMRNGYATDLHECNRQINSIWMLGYDPQLVDMDTVVEGGQPGAVVTGLIVQEQDNLGNVIFQWRSWDHYEITDASPWVDLTAATIDYVHGNTIEIVDENSILISCRNMNEITKIDRNNGEIIWRMGGPACKNNMFTFINDSLQFRMQHDVRYHPLDMITVYNNGNGNQPDPYSSPIMYGIIEDSLEVFEIRRYHNDPEVYGDIMGNFQYHLPSRNFVTGWGRPHNNIVMTEFTYLGEPVMQVKMPYTVYRSFKFDWETSILVKSTDTLDFGDIYYKDSLYMSFSITNDNWRNIEINGLHLHGNNFFLLGQSSLPIIIESQEQRTFGVWFKPKEPGDHNDILSLYEDIENDSVTQRIACQVKLVGSARDSEGTYESESEIFSIAPNPGNGIFNIEISGRHLPVTISTYSASGNLLQSKQYDHSDNLHIDLNKYPDGIFYVSLFVHQTKIHQTQKVIKISD